MIGGELGFLTDPPSLNADFEGELQRVVGEEVIASDAIGSRFLPRTRQRALESADELDGAAILQLSDPTDGATDFWPVNWMPNNRLSATGSRRLGATINPRNGLFRGRVIDLNNGDRPRLEGVIFQKQQLIGGMHRAPNQPPGAVILEPGEW